IRFPDGVESLFIPTLNCTANLLLIFCCYFKNLVQEYWVQSFAVRVWNGTPFCPAYIALNSRSAYPYLRRGSQINNCLRGRFCFAFASARNPNGVICRSKPIGCGTLLDDMS